MRTDAFQNLCVCVCVYVCVALLVRSYMVPCMEIIMLPIRERSDLASVSV